MVLPSSPHWLFCTVFIKCFFHVPSCFKLYPCGCFQSYYLGWYFTSGLMQPNHRFDAAESVMWNLVIVLIVFGDHKGLILIRECLCQGRLLDASSLHLAKPFVRMPWVVLNVSEILGSHLFAIYRLLGYIDDSRCSFHSYHQSGYVSLWIYLWQFLYNSCPSSKLHVGQDGKAVQMKFTCTVKHLKPWML